MRRAVWQGSRNFAGWGGFQHPMEQQDLILSLVAVLCAALAVATVAFAITFGG